MPAFGSTPFGASAPGFGTASSSQAFGSSPSPFGQTSASAFGSTTFGTSSPSLFGSSSPAFGAGSTSAFGAASTSAFGAQSTSAFGGGLFGSSQPASSSGGLFGVSTSAFGGTSTAQPFGQQSQPAFGSKPLWKLKHSWFHIWCSIKASRINAIFGMWVVGLIAFALLIYVVITVSLD